MKARRGQVALYLLAVLVGIAILVLMNVSLYLTVSAKNRAMNAGDAAALAVARHQGELLNRMGKFNLDHLQAAFDGKLEDCADIMREQARVCFLEPLDGIQIGNDAAEANGAEESDSMRDLLKEHASDIRNIYVNNPESYPEPWEGAWDEYAQRLEIAISGPLFAAPDNVEFVDAATGHFLIDKRFYEAVNGRCWCWFHFNAAGLLDGYSSFRSWGPLPSADDETRRRRCVNSEVYSLGLEARTGSALTIFGRKLIGRLLGKDEADVVKAPLLADETQVWYCYGKENWRTWWEIDPDGEWQFPVVGSVRPEYDVRGCAACCRVVMSMPSVISENECDRETYWTGAAKPFGTVSTDDESSGVVTALKYLVTSAFSEVRLVPLDTVGGRELSTADADWMHHIRDHLPSYMLNGPDSFASCRYCRTLAAWERESLRSDGREWLKDKSTSCVRPTPGGTSRGGTPHGH